MEANMRPQPSSIHPPRRRAARARTRIVFFLVRRALRRAGLMLRYERATATRSASSEVVTHTP
jgi:hypothetical protein